jgi:hypothetical protein
MKVYFIRPIGMPGSPVKIGCSDFPENRLVALSSWSPYRLEVVATVPGDRSLERRLHGIFAAQHSHREWFLSSPELESLLARLVAGESIEAVIDLSAPVAPFRPKNTQYMTPDWRKRTSYGHRLRWAFRPLRETGTDRWTTPDDVDEIMGDWAGHGDQGHPVTPSAEQLRRLEEVIADPATHAVVPSWIREKAAA